MTKTIAITGGARGIGAATARLLGSKGHTLVLGDIDGDAVSSTATAIANDTGATVIGLPLDVSDRGSFASFLDAAEGAAGPIDALINNAGIMPTGAFLDETDAVTDRQIDINLRGVITGTKLAGRRFADRGAGQIVNVASLMGLTTAAGVAVYCATKHAVVGLGAALHQELAPLGVSVATICPGFVRTELIAGLNPNPLVEYVGAVDPEDVAREILRALDDDNGGQRIVPRLGGTIVRALGVVPENWRNVVSRGLGLQSLGLHADEDARSAYRARTEV